eukprot:CAMPEP_0196671018 /NCGR_PEP_ID=MMETSP1090-20130531/1562_1 /TAXON_ID=37098 /ORGANISM="Isochrysis sp, Strain CCMP1244" /LENGTH=212 /DNA_ID=CAMNT_0042008647 /DNA_START=33 /DNA_END=671 /DNA_ORIENTATION=-
MLFLLAIAAPRDYYICNFTCPSNESWSACRSERCSAPALPEDLCSGGEEPAASAELVAGPGACEAYAVDAGSFKERCGICTALSRAALAAATSGAAEEDAALCAAAASATAASELPPLRTCRLDPSACASLLEQLQEATCPHAAQMIRAGASRAAVLWKAQQLCGERLRQRHNTTLFEATTCEAPREVGLRVMAISACVAAAVFSVQVFARG